MDKLLEIQRRWERMGKSRYGLGVIESFDKVKVNEPCLVVYNDRPAPSPELTMCAIIGPRSDPDSLEDAIAYIEAPNDIAYLLAENALLKEQIEDLNLEYLQLQQETQI